MALSIAEYAVIGNRETIALVGRDGSIDWLCLPRFDSDACFAALLGTSENGRWKIAPVETPMHVKRRYRDRSLVLETLFQTPHGAVELVDVMSRRTGESDVIRVVRGIEGRVRMRMELIVRFDYGRTVPWVTRTESGALSLVAGPNRLVLKTPIATHGEDLRTIAEFEIEAGREVPFTLGWSCAYRQMPSLAKSSPQKILEDEHTAWVKWSHRYKADGEWGELVLRSLITLRALTHYETGGIVAAGTTSLPELLGGSRNWDYRFCWLRDSAFTLQALEAAGFVDEAIAWREWLLRAVAGSPAQMQIMYSVAGERCLNEFEANWLPGYEDSRPVRIGNAASNQVQLDVYGEVSDMLHVSRRVGLAPLEHAWDLQMALVEHLETVWTEPDDGIWEIRGPRRHFTHSKVMAWVALDRAISSIEQFGHLGPLERWRNLRTRIHEEVCARGFDDTLGSFVQYYGAKCLDSSLLLIPLVGFLPADDPRVKGTIFAVEQHLMQDGLVARYNTNEHIDGLDGSEGAFLACSFWLADNYVQQGRKEEARWLFERLVSLCNDVGLLSEEYDTKSKRLVGNFPQAFSHVALINTALHLGEKT